MPSSAGFLSASWSSQGVCTESTGIRVQSPLHALDSERERGKGLCLGEHWGFALPPQCSSPIKLIPLMQLNSCFFTRGFSVGFYYECHQSLPQEQTLGLLGLAVTQSQQCWCISLHSTGLLSAGHSPSPALREFIPLDT